MTEYAGHGGEDEGHPTGRAQELPAVHAQVASTPLGTRNDFPLSASSIYICRRWGKGEYCKENALVANLGLPRTQSAGKSFSMPCARTKERNVAVARPERSSHFRRTIL